MKLIINTKDQKQVSVSLTDGLKDSLKAENEYGSQVLLSLIKKILQKNGLKISQIRKIEVETGPGSYTGLKVGVAVANALAFALNIPVNNKKIETNINY